jgi:hypothetical protein
MRFLVTASILFAATAARADAPVKQAAPVAKSTATAPSDVRMMHTDDCARARAQNKTCVIDMGKGDDVEGNAPGAGGIGIIAIETTKAASLIHLRRDFIVEILKSAEDLE